MQKSEVSKILLSTNDSSQSASFQLRTSPRGESAKKNKKKIGLMKVKQWYKHYSMLDAGLLHKLHRV